MYQGSIMLDIYTFQGNHFRFSGNLIPSKVNSIAFCGKKGVFTTIDIISMTNLLLI